MVHAWANVRRFGDIFVSRRDVTNATREVDPEGVEFRRQDKHRRRGYYHIKGPNRVWSVDGHDKLKEFGFEIYGCIDGYARYILNVDIGICNGCEVAIQKFYLVTVSQYDTVPYTVTSDKGKETSLMAECQLRLRRYDNSNVPFLEYNYN